MESSAPQVRLQELNEPIVSEEERHVDAVAGSVVATHIQIVGE